MNCIFILNILNLQSSECCLSSFVAVSHPTTQSIVFFSFRSLPPHINSLIMECRYFHQNHIGKIDKRRDLRTKICFNDVNWIVTGEKRQKREWKSIRKVKENIYHKNKVKKSFQRKRNESQWILSVSINNKRQGIKTQSLWILFFKRCSLRS